jgi:hypothetical protein
MAWRVDTYLKVASGLPRPEACRQAGVLSERFIAQDAWINIVLIAGLLIGVVFVLLFAPLGIGSRLTLVATGLIGGIVLVGIYDNERMRSRIDRHLDHHLCFRCGYAMTDLPCDERRCLRCPECGHLSPSLPNALTAPGANPTDGA